jgi:integrase
MRKALSQVAVERAVCPAGKSEIILWDPTLPGFGARVRASGGRTWIVSYRTARSRVAPKKRLTLGDVKVLPLGEARRLARTKLGEIASGRDPAAEVRAKTRRERARLEPALDAYEAALERRQVVKRKDLLSLLRRELLAPLSNVDLDGIDRQILAERVAAIAASGRAGTATDFKVRVTVFLNWCVDNGLIAANPAAGWRRPRATRAERLEPTGRALADAELSTFWTATEAGGPWFGAYLRLLLLCGTRRRETSLARWQDLDLAGGAWTLPPEATKSGRALRVPLPPEAVAILEGLPRTSSPLVFPGRGGVPMSGWSKRLAPVYERTRGAGLAEWTPHDLRRTFRSGLATLGVDHTVAELMLGHVVPGGTLAPIYDRAERWPERVEAARRWAEHVSGLVDKMVPLPRRARG